MILPYPIRESSSKSASQLCAFFISKPISCEHDRFWNEKAPFLHSKNGARSSSDRGRIRTFDRLLRRQVLYPAELCDLLFYLCCYSALTVPIKIGMFYPAELCDKIQKIKKPNKFYIVRLLSGWQDSNLRPPAPKAGAITGLRYTPKCFQLLARFAFLLKQDNWLR